MVVKKYGNRRLYDTEASRYITLEELATKIREGTDVQVVDAKTGRDLTQGTLAHIILESRGASKLLPVPLLVQLIRMGDDLLSEFFTLYMSSALELYLATRRGAKMVIPLGPLSGLATNLAQNPFVRMFRGPAIAPREEGLPDPRLELTTDGLATAEQVSELRAEIEDLRQVLQDSALPLKPRHVPDDGSG